ncbi:MAG: phenylalanine--tRNA ligase subunit beta [Acidobacteria bacterium]|nr:phenylalanine--tRNA ligase subunit beta [Acidobacteriota bacterium]
MRILVSWLRELVPVTVSVDELAEALTAHGFEVSAVDPAPPIPGRPARGEDAVLDLEITTNRPDCLSVAGIAREVSTIYGGAITWPALADTPTGDDALPVTIEEDALALCPRYAASVAEVRVAPSPAWMAARLEAAEVRPINNVVDVTNYVMLELGQPMHAFDLDRLAGGELRIRRARAGETVRTLDGVERQLAGDMLVIADGALPQAVAGVMGGADSEVGDRTARIAFESAWFDPVSVRRTSKRLALSTDASFRFERGADVEAPVQAMRRAQQLLTEIGGGTPRGPIVDRYPTPRHRATVTLRHARIGHVLGVEVEPGFVPATLERLGFGVDGEATEGGGRPRWRVTVPPHRGDVSREIDLIEEIARHHGYERFPSTFPALVRPPAPASGTRSRQRLLRRVLTAGGCSEAITYGFIEEAAGRPFVGRADDLVRIANPLSEKFAVLRPSLIPGLLDALIHNRRREHRDIRLFEIGRRFTSADGETAGFAVALTGASAPRHWSGGQRQTDLFDIIGLVDRVCDAFGVTPAYEPVERDTLVRGRTAAVQATLPDAAEPLQLGYVGQLAPAIAEARGLPADDEIYVAELDLPALTSGGSNPNRMVAAPLPRYPSIVRDLAVIVDAALPAGTVRDTIRSVAPETLLQVREFDLYQGKGIPDGHMSLAFRLTFRAADRTLTDVEVQQATNTIVDALKATHQATLRQGSAP